MKRTTLLVFIAAPVIVLASPGAAFLKIPVRPRAVSAGLPLALQDC